MAVAHAMVMVPALWCSMSRSMKSYRACNFIESYGSSRNCELVKENEWRYG